MPKVFLVRRKSASSKVKCKNDIFRSLCNNSNLLCRFKKEIEDIRLNKNQEKSIASKINTTDDKGNNNNKDIVKSSKFDEDTNCGIFSSINKTSDCRDDTEALHVYSMSPHTVQTKNNQMDHIYSKNYISKDSNSLWGYILPHRRSFHSDADSFTESLTDEKPFSCSTCGKSFRLSSTLCRHKIIHTSQRPHKCYVCSKSFNRSSTLKTHLLTHNSSKEFVCNVCGKGFHQKGNLRNHILIHTGEKPYSCRVCKKSFNKLSNLKFHMHIHTDQKPYRCRFCKLSMARRGELKQHINTYHVDEL